MQMQMPWAALHHADFLTSTLQQLFAAAAVRCLLVTLASSPDLSPSCRLAREAEAMRSRAMELEREMEKLRTGRPMQARCGHAVVMLWPAAGYALLAVLRTPTAWLPTVRAI